MKMICLNCPMGCQLIVTMSAGIFETKGHKCPKGLAFAEREWFYPVRMLTTTVKTQDEHLRRVPVRTTTAIPKERIMEAMIALDSVIVAIPITIGTVVVHNLLNMGVDVIATFTMHHIQDLRITNERNSNLGGH